MLTHFNANDFLRLSIAERIRKCQELAAESEWLASTATADLCDIYLDVALHWRALATELDRSVAAAA